MFDRSGSVFRLAIRCCVMAVVLPLSAFAQQQFYVSPTGSDTNPGTLNAPWKTIQHAADVVPPDSVVNVHAGIYNKRITFNVSGTDDTYSGELLIQYDARRCTINNNIFKAGAQSVLISNPFTQVTGLVIDNNCFDVPSGAGDATFVWKNHEYNSFNAYKNNTGNDVNSQFANPQYVALGASPDLHIQSTSPCRDAGDDAAVPPSSTLDIDNEARIVDAHVDQGADEYFVPGGCSADFNNDGLVNTQDVLAFLNAWTANDPVADFNNDGLINTQDVLAFLNAWTAGC